MDTLYKHLLRFNQMQIFAIGATALVVWLAAMLLVVSPLLMVVFAGLGAGWASLIAVLGAIGGAIVGVSAIGKVTGQALLNREAAEALERLVMAFVESKENDNG